MKSSGFSCKDLRAVSPSWSGEAQVHFGSKMQSLFMSLIFCKFMKLFLVFIYKSL